jgi:NIL domain
MSNQPTNAASERALHSIDIHIPQHLHQEPVLATLIGNYNLVVNFKAAVLDRQATGGGWFNLSLEGSLKDIEAALNYLQHLGVEIFAHIAVPIVMRLEEPEI